MVWVIQLKSVMLRVLEFTLTLMHWGKTVFRIFRVYCSVLTGIRESFVGNAAINLMKEERFESCRVLGLHVLNCGPALKIIFSVHGFCSEFLICYQVSGCCSSADGSIPSGKWSVHKGSNSDCEVRFCFILIWKMRFCVIGWVDLALFQRELIIFPSFELVIFLRSYSRADSIQGG